MERHALLAHPPSSDLPLGIPGFRYSDLHDSSRLAQLTAAFDDFLRAEDGPLFSRYDAHRGGGAPLRGPEESELLLEVGAHLSRFVARLFNAEDDFAALRDAAGRDAPIFRVKREFVQRRVFKKGARDRPHADDFAGLDARVQPLLAAARSGRGSRRPRAGGGAPDRGVARRRAAGLGGVAGPARPAPARSR